MTQYVWKWLLVLTALASIAGCSGSSSNASNGATSTVAKMADAAANTSGPQVNAPAAGTVAGVTASNVDEYLGIPYALPPTGDLRWKAPQAKPKWQGVYSATQLPGACPQAASDVGIASTNEDCLYLSVYVPHGGASSKPVMVYFHGGAFFLGASALYDGSALATQGDVIVVTVNYRLGYLGFLAHPALAAEDANGNTGSYGLMDQQLALKWVQQNIAAFGGNAGNVTIFGQSAGGQSVVDHLASPGSAGLFQRAIIQSGTYGIQLPTMSSAETSGTTWANSLGCTSATDASCLRQLSVAAILSSEGSLASATQAQLNQYDPVVGNAVLPKQPLELIETGQFNKVPVLDGQDHDDARLFVAQQYDLQSGPLTAAQYSTAPSSFLPSFVVPLAELLYPLNSYPNPSTAFATMYTDAGFACSAELLNSMIATQGVPVYAFEFSDESAWLYTRPAVSTMNMGAFHTSELPFLWPNLLQYSPYGITTLSPAEQKLSAAMIASWTTFARTGSPTNALAPDWVPYNILTNTTESLVAPQPVSIITHAADHKCSFWKPLETVDAVTGWVPVVGGLLGFQSN